MQMTLFDMTREEYHIDKPIRLIELFAGIGAQAMAFLHRPFRRLAILLNEFVQERYTQGKNYTGWT